MKIKTRIRNSRRALHKGGLWDLGDPGAFTFGGLHLNIEGSSGDDAKLRWKAEQQASFRECAATDSFSLIQHGSGSAAWSNTNHNDADDRPTLVDRRLSIEFCSPVCTNSLSTTIRTDATQKGCRDFKVGAE